MKFKAIYSVLGLALAASMFMGNSTGPNANGNGNHSGSNASNTCASCHGAAASAAATAINITDTLGTAATAYTPGEVYRVSVALSNPPGGGPAVNTGFQATVRNSDNSATVGTLAADAGATNVRLANGLAEHSQMNQVSNVFFFRWTAPAAGTGNVQIFANGVIANNNGQNSGDIVTPVATLTLAEAGAIAVNEPTQAQAPKAYLFPTRVGSDVNVRFTAVHEMEYTMEVLSVMGQVLRTETVRVGSGEQTQTLNVGDLAQGVYYLRLRTNRSVEAVLPFQK